MIINKIRLTEFIFVIILKILLINSCRVRQNNISKVDDYFSHEELVNENEEENQKYDQKIFTKDFKSLCFKSNSLILGDPCYYLNSANPVTIYFDLLRNHSESLQINPNYSRSLGDHPKSLRNYRPLHTTESFKNKDIYEEPKSV